MNTSLAVLLAVLLLMGNAFFVGAEFAIISARRSAIEPLAAADRRARTVLWAMEHVSLMLACAQLGVTVCSTSLGLVAEPAIAHLLGRPLGLLGASPSLAHPIALVLALVLVVFLHVVLAEMVPKNLAVADPDRAVLLLGPALVWIARLVQPVVGSLDWSANRVLRLFGVEPRSEIASAFTAQEVQSIVERSRAAGLLDDTSGLLSGAIEFSDRTAADVMVPFAHLRTVASGANPDDIERLVARTGYSRFPVVGPAGELTGYVHLKDVLYADDVTRFVPVPAWRVRALAAVAPEAEVEDALAAMQASGSHLARVDDDGRAVGVVFLEDILEELVGEVRDAMQREDPR